MARLLKTNALVTSAFRRSMIPEDQSTFTCCDVIDIMNEEMGIHVVPLVLRAHEEYYVTVADLPVSSGTVEYKIPYRAIGNKLRDVKFVNSNGFVTEMTRLSLEEKAAYERGEYQLQYIPYYVENDNIVLFADPGSTGSIRMYYYLRPNDLVKNKRGAIVTAVCAGACSTTFTVCTFPCHFTTALEYDFVQGKSPNKVLGFDRTVCSICATSKTLTFANTSLTSVNTFNSCTRYITFAVGDVISQAEETIYPQIPTELQPILPQRTAVKMLEALGDSEGMANAQKELERMEYNSMTLIDNRVEGSPQKIVNRNSPLRGFVSRKLKL